MTTREAKKILELYRPGAADAHDPGFAGALALARQDAELWRWLEENHAVQSAIRARFKQISPHAGLKHQIISEYNSARVVKVWWRQPSVLAAAAMLILFIGLAVFRHQQKADDARQDNFVTFRARMVSAALRNYPMTLETADASQIRDHLADQHAPNDYTLTGPLENTTLAGCGVLSWRERKVAMVCFRTGRPLDPGEKSDLFLFVVESKAMGQSPKSSSPEFKQVNKLTTASWTAGKNTYILASPGDEEFIRRFL